MGKKYKKGLRQIFNGFTGKIPLGNKPSIFVAMPLYDHMDNWTQQCWDITQHWFDQRNIKIMLYTPMGISHIDKARNQCIEEFLKTDCTHLLFIDGDMVWNPESIEKFLLYNEPVVSAIPTQKVPPFKPTVYMVAKDDNGQPNTYWLQLGMYPLDRPFYWGAAGVGAAFMMIKREVIEKMEVPWFATPPYAKTTSSYGEDFFFTIGMTLKGYKILFDPTVRIYHIGKCLFGLEDHIVYKNEEAEGNPACHFMSTNVKSVEELKSSYLGPQPALIQSTAPAVGRQAVKLVSQGDSKLELWGCPLSESADPMTPPKPTGFDAPKSPKPMDVSTLPKTPNTEGLKTPD